MHCGAISLLGLRHIATTTQSRINVAIASQLFINILVHDTVLSQLDLVVESLRLLLMFMWFFLHHCQTSIALLISTDSIRGGRLWRLAAQVFLLTLVRTSSDWLVRGHEQTYLVSIMSSISCGGLWVVYWLLPHHGYLLNYSFCLSNIASNLIEIMLPSLILRFLQKL